MSETDLCRLCANLAGPANSGKLFERSQRKLLRQIADLTGLQLKNAKDLPEHICTPCEEQTLQSHRFRERCIRTQKFFEQQSNQVAAPPNKKKKLEPHDKSKSKEELEEVVLADITTVKVEEKKEEEDDNENENEVEDKKMLNTAVDIPNLINEKQEHKEELVMPIIAEVLLKGEPIESDDDDDNSSSASVSDGFNPLDEKDENSSSGSNDHSMASDGSEFVPLEPEISLVTEEQQLAKGKKKTECKNKSQKTKEKKPPKKLKVPKKEKLPKEKKPKKEPKVHNLICDQCGKHFKCPRKLEDHLLRHAGDKQHQCKMCPQKFYSYQALHRHIRTHSGEKPYGCRYCERHFMDDSSRVRHERVHTNTRPFACSICKKTFITNYMLKDHMVIHSGERAFKCPMCSVSFTRKTHLRTHYRSMTHKQNEEKHHKFLNQSVTAPAQEEFNYVQNPVIAPIGETNSFL